MSVLKCPLAGLATIAITITAMNKAAIITMNNQITRDSND